MWLASALFDAGVPEKIIQGRTGHKSTDGLRAYERVTEMQHEKVSKILSGSLDKFDSDGQCSSNPDSTTSSLPKPKTPFATQYNNCTVNVYSAPSYPHYPLPHYYQMPMPFCPESGHEVFPMPSFPTDFYKN